MAHLSHLMTNPTKWHVHPAKTQISLGIRPVWSVFAVCMKKHWTLNYLLSAQWRLWSDWVTGLIWVFAGCIVVLLVLSWGGYRQWSKNNKSSQTNRISSNMTARVKSLEHVFMKNKSAPLEGVVASAITNDRYMYGGIQTIVQYSAMRLSV